MNTEEWRPIEGFRGYEVSNLGRVRSYLTSQGAEGQLRARPRIKRLTADAEGRPCVELATRFGRVVRRVDMLVCAAFGSEVAW